MGFLDKVKGLFTPTGQAPRYPYQGQPIVIRNEFPPKSVIQQKLPLNIREKQELARDELKRVSSKIDAEIEKLHINRGKDKYVTNIKDIDKLPGTTRIDLPGTLVRDRGTRGGTRLIYPPEVQNPVMIDPVLMTEELPGYEDVPIQVVPPGAGGGPGAPLPLPVIPDDIYDPYDPDNSEIPQPEAPSYQPQTVLDYFRPVPIGTTLVGYERDRYWEEDERRRKLREEERRRVEETIERSIAPAVVGGYEAVSRKVSDVYGIVKPKVKETIDKARRIEEQYKEKIPSELKFITKSGFGSVEAVGDVMKADVIPYTQSVFEPAFREGGVVKETIDFIGAAGIPFGMGSYTATMPEEQITTIQNIDFSKPSSIIQVYKEGEKAQLKQRQLSNEYQRILPTSTNVQSVMDRDPKLFDDINSLEGLSEEQKAKRIDKLDLERRWDSFETDLYTTANMTPEQLDKFSSKLEKFNKEIEGFSSIYKKEKDKFGFAADVKYGVGQAAEWYIISKIPLGGLDKLKKTKSIKNFVDKYSKGVTPGKQLLIKYAMIPTTIGFASIPAWSEAKELGTGAAITGTIGRSFGLGITGTIGSSVKETRKFFSPFTESKAIGRGLETGADITSVVIPTKKEDVFAVFQKTQRNIQEWTKQRYLSRNGLKFKVKEKILNVKLEDPIYTAGIIGKVPKEINLLKPPTKKKVIEIGKIGEVKSRGNTNQFIVQEQAKGTLGDFKFWDVQPEKGTLFGQTWIPIKKGAPFKIDIFPKSIVKAGGSVEETVAHELFHYKYPSRLRTFEERALSKLKKSYWYSPEEMIVRAQAKLYDLGLYGFPLTKDIFGVSKTRLVRTWGLPARQRTALIPSPVQKVVEPYTKFTFSSMEGVKEPGIKAVGFATGYQSKTFPNIFFSKGITKTKIRGVQRTGVGTSYLRETKLDKGIRVDEDALIIVKKQGEEAKKVYEGFGTFKSLYRDEGFQIANIKVIPIQKKPTGIKIIDTREQQEMVLKFVKSGQAQQAVASTFIIPPKPSGKVLMNLAPFSSPVRAQVIEAIPKQLEQPQLRFVQTPQRLVSPPKQTGFLDIKLNVSPLFMPKFKVGTGILFKDKQNYRTRLAEAARYEYAQSLAVAQIPMFKKAQAQRTREKLRTKSRLKTKTVQRAKQIQIQSFKPLLKPKIGPPGGFFFWGLDGESKGLFGVPKKKKEVELFAVFVRQKGKWIRIGKALPRGKASALGAKNVRETLAASFKIVPVGKSVSVKDVPFSVSSQIFRAPKSGERNIFIQRGGREPTFVPGARLSSKSERIEFIKARKASNVKFWR